jgi:hypothetical protein
MGHKRPRPSFEAAVIKPIAACAFLIACHAYI